MSSWTAKTGFLATGRTGPGKPRSWRLPVMVFAAACGAPLALAQAAKPVLSPNYGTLPLSFTANLGQTDQSVKFLAKGQGYGLYLTGREAVLTLNKLASRTGQSAGPSVDRRRFKPGAAGAGHELGGKTTASSSLTDTVHMELKGANSEAPVNGSEVLPGTTNYFLGNDPTKWRTKVPSFAKVRYTGVYPGIDLVYYGNQRRLEYDFVVAPHANPKLVELHFSGAQHLKLDDRGNLLVIAGNGEVAFEKPVIYQDKSGRRVPVKGRFTLLADNSVGFQIGRYDRGKSLVIDPVLSYSTYLGGSSEDAAIAIAVDGTGSIYVAGLSLDADFPVTQGAVQTTNTVDNAVAFVAKLNAAGSALVYATYLGGSSTATVATDSEATGLAVDAAGNAYVCGETYASNFPTTAGALQTTNKAFAHGAQNAFLSKVSADGTTLAYSTYLGGSGLSISGSFFDGDTPLRMAIDAAGSAYVVGTAYSTDFPTTPGAYQVTNKAAANLAPNTFVAKFSPAGNSLTYSTYLGGTGVNPADLPDDAVEGVADQGYGIAIDGAGEAYVAGYTYSADFPVTTNGYQQVNHALANLSTNAYVSKLNATGTALLSSTYLGGTGVPLQGNTSLDLSEIGDEAIGVTLDGQGSVYVAGVAASTDFPTSAAAFQKVNKAAANSAVNVFVSKLDSALSTLTYSTYVGGSGSANTDSALLGSGDFATGVVVDAAGNAYITGTTESPDFPVTGDAFQSGPRNTQLIGSGFFTEVSPDGSALQYSTYLGGSGASSYFGTSFVFYEGDFGYDLTLDGSGNVYLAGYAFSYDFPVTKDALQKVNNAGGGPGGNAFITKFGATAGAAFLPTTTALTSLPGTTSVAFTALVKGTPGAGTPTGSVNFFVSSVKAATVAIDGTGSASFTDSQLGDTLTNVIAAYSGDTVFGASGSSLGQQFSTATQLAFMTPPAATITPGGNGGTAIVTVEDASGSVVSTSSVPVTVTIAGPVGFAPQTSTIASQNGVATFSLAGNALTTPGSYTYTATSTGLISATALETVSGGAGTPVTMVVSGPTPSPIFAGQSATYTVTELDVTGAPVAGDNDIVNLTLTGNQEYDFQVTLSDGVATTDLSLNEPSPPNYVLTGTDPANGLTASDTFAVSSQAGPGNNFAAISLSSSPSAPYYYDQIAITATVTGTATPPPTGTITYSVDGQTDQAVTVPLSGGPGAPTNPTTATFLIGPLPAGANFVSVTYNGDPTVGFYAQSGPQILNLTVADAPLGFLSSERDTGFPGNSIAVDPNGNVYTANFSSGAVLEFDPTGKQTTVPLTGVVNPAGLAADANGNLFITDSGTNQVYEYSATNGQTTMGFQGLSGPGKIAVDGNGNTYVVDTNNNRVVLLNSNSTQSVVPATGLSGPEGVAVDGAGNLYIADTGNSQVVKIDGRQTQTTVFLTGFPSAVSVDAAGDLYVADEDSFQLFKIDTFGHKTQINSALTEIADIAADASGNVFTTNAPQGTSFGQEVSTNSGIRLPDTAVAGASTLARANYLIPQALEGAPNALATDLTGNSEFATQSSVNCTDGVAVPCSYVVNFAPILPGVRTGSLSLNTGGGALLTTPVYGNGLAPLAVFDPRSSTNLSATGLTHPLAVALDSVGNAYIADGSNIFKLAPGGTPAVFFQGAEAFGGVAADGLGNVYATYPGSTLLLQISPQGVSTNLASNLTSPGPVAVDGAGNVYVGAGGFDGSGPGQILKFAPSGTSSLITGNLPAVPAGLAVDGQGNVYAPTDSGILSRTTPGGAVSTTTVTFTIGALATDAAGEVYVVDTNNDRIIRIDLAGNSTVLSSGGAGVSGLALDGLGNVVFTNTNPVGVSEINRSTDGLNFLGVNVGNQSSQGLFTVTNAGNQPLVLTNITVPSPFVQQPTSQGRTACTSATTVPAGADCQIPVVFAPTAAGAVSETASLTDNSLNLAGSTQGFTLQGTGNGSTLTPTTIALTVNPGSGSFSGQPVTLTAVLAPFVSGNTSTDGETLTFQAGGGVTVGTAVLTGGVATLTTSALPEGQIVLTAAYAGDANLAPSTSNPVGYTVLPVGPTVTGLVITSIGRPVTKVFPGTVVTLTASVTSVGDLASRGIVNFCDATAAVCESSALLGSAQVTLAGMATLQFVPGIGIHSYRAVFIGTNNHAPSTSPAQGLTVIGLYPSATTIAAAGGPGNYALTGTVVGTGSAALAPTGTLSFLDTSNSNQSLGTAALGTAVAALSFVDQQNPTNVGPGGNSVVAGDFNGDGKIDLVVASSGTSTREIVLLLGDGAGGFSTSVTTAQLPQVTSLAVGDFNSDGTLDLAVARKSDGLLEVDLGNGTGLTATSTVATGTGPVSPVVADFNGDGLTDVAVANSGDNTVTVLLNRGNGSFAAATTTPATGLAPVALAVGDFNGDGHPDLAVANSGGNTVTILLGTGVGTFTPAAASPATGKGPTALAVGDFNGDGKADLAVSSYDPLSGTSVVTVLLGNGDGSFTPTAASPATGAAPSSVAVGDFNGDGKADLAVSGQNASTVSLFLGDGTGGFTLSSATATGPNPASLAIGDFNGDGVPDVVTVNQGSTTMTVLVTQQTQTATATVTNVSVSSGTHDVAASFPGDTNFSTSTSATTPLSGAAISPTTLTLSASPASGSFAGQAVTLTATLAPFNGGGNTTDGEQVTFQNGGTTLGSGPLAGGVAAFTTSSLPEGTNSLTAIYSGDANFGTSTTVALIFTVSAPPPEVSPAAITFGNQPYGTPSGAQVVTVTDPGTTDLTFNGIGVDFGSNLADFTQTNNCPATLTPGSSCQISVIFTPAGVGLRTANLDIYFIASQTQRVPVSGTGTGGILQVNPGNLKTIAGNGTAGYTGDGGPASLAALNEPIGTVFDAAGNLYIADQQNSVIRKVDTAGDITTVAGTGTAGYTGDGGPATSAEISFPWSVAIDPAGNLYIQDGNNVIRKVDTAGTITTFAGNGQPGYSGDGGPAINAEFSDNLGFRFDSAGNLYIAQCIGSVVRKIDTSGIVTTVAGNGTYGFSGDGGAATAAELGCPAGVAIDAAGNLLIAEFGNSILRKVSTTGIISTIAGNLTAGYSGDGGPATSAQLNNPSDLQVDSAGNIYVADNENGRIRKIDTTGTITTVAGGLNNAGSAGVNTPLALTLDSANNLYFSDSGNNAVRQFFPAGIPAFPSTPIGTAAASQTITLSNIGNLPVTIASQSSFTLSGNTADFSLIGGTCLQGATLAANGGSCGLQIGFTPTAVGARTLNGSVIDDALDQPQTFQITGTGTGAALAPTTLGLTASPAGSSFTGQPVTLLATLAPFNGGGNTTDGETVTFQSGGVTLGTGVLTGGVATFATSALPEGADSLTAVYAGDANFAASTSNSLAYSVVTVSSTAISLVINAGGNAVTQVASGTAVSLTATVTANGAPANSGLVTFCDATAALCENSALLGSAQITPAGTATLQFVPGIGSHSYKAIFAGTNSNATSTSPAQALTVTGLYPSITTIAATGAAGNYTLTGTVAGTGSAALAPAGTLAFLDTSNGNLALGTAALGAATVTLNSTVSATPATGTAPREVATGDFNGDGIPDLAVANDGDNFTPGSVTVLIGKGDGTFTAMTAAPATGIEPSYVSVGDFNGDGKADLAVLNYGVVTAGVLSNGTVTVLLGNGDGTFAAVATSPSTGVQPQAIAIGDFNGDGVADLAIANGTSNTITILLGAGDGTFTAAADLVTGSGAYLIATGDFNGDGKADLAVTNFYDNTVSVLLGHGDGSFTAATSPVTGNKPGGIVTADFNGDGKADLAVANTSDNTLTVLLGNGDGTFAAAASPSTSSFPFGITAADFDGDGQIDLAVVNQNSNSVTIFQGNGQGGFTNALTSLTGNTPVSLARGDFNGDGVPDVAVENSADNTVTVLLTQRTQTATATLANVSVPGSGTHNVEASYPGDANFSASTSTTTPLTASLLATTLTLTSNSASGAAGATVTFTAGLNPANIGNAATDGEPISFFDGTTSIGQSGLSGGTAQLTITTLGTGSHSVTAVYGGDTFFATSTSNAVAYTVGAATPAPQIANLAPNTAVVGSADTTVTITGANFVSGAAVTVNGTSQPAIFASATQLGTVIAAAQLATAQTLTLTVVNPGGIVSNTLAFTVFAPPLQLSSTSVVFGSQTVGTQSAAIPVTLTNTATTAYTITGINLGLGTDPSDFAQTNNCPATLAAGASCQISIVFTPAGVGAKSAGIEIDDDSPVPSQFVSVSGTGAGGILQVDPGNLKAIAGNGTAGFSGDNGPGPLAELSGPVGIGFDTAGNLYIADQQNNVVRKVDTSGNITTIAGNGTKGFSGDGGPATSAALNLPSAVVADTVGNLYIGDPGNYRVRKIDTNGVITTFAGNGTRGFSGDGGPAISAEVTDVQNARFDAAGNLYVPQCRRSSIRRIDTSGIITTVAGTGVAGFSGDGGQATGAQLNCPSGVTFDTAGNLYIADFGNSLIRKVDTTGVITTIAGNGTAGFSGDGGPATSAQLNIPNDIVADTAGNLYIADDGNNRLRKIDSTGVMTTLAGGLNKAGSAGMNSPLGVTLDAAGNLYFSDSGNNAVREVFPAGPVVFPPTPVGISAVPQTVTLSNIGNVDVLIASQTSFALSGNSADFSLTGGTCLQGATLTANGGSCTLQVGFTPTATGARSLNVAVTDTAVFSPQSFQISGTATPATSTTLVLAASSNLVRTPAAISLTATLAAAPGATGTLTFLDGSTSLGQATLSATGTAGLTGVVLSVGSHSLTAVYSGDAKYAATTSAPTVVVVEPLALSLGTISPTAVVAGSYDTTLTATGTNFSTTSVVNANGTPLATMFVSATQLTAFLPASQLANAGSISVTVTDTYSSSTSAPQAFTILPVTSVTFTGPPTTGPGQQSTPVNFLLQQAYPIALAGTMTLTFTPDQGNPSENDQLQFATGGTVFSFALPSNTTVTPVILLQVGTISGTITITLQLTANGINVTPPNLAPIMIVVPKAAPTISALSFTASGNTLTVLVTGYSSTREIQSADFTFKAASGATLAKSVVAVPATTLFSTWYANADSVPFGSEFTYSQIFTLSASATEVSGIGVTLTNTIGTSTEATAP